MKNALPVLLIVVILAVLLAGCTTNSHQAEPSPGQDPVFRNTVANSSGMIRMSLNQIGEDFSGSDIEALNRSGIRLGEQASGDYRNISIIPVSDSWKLPKDYYLKSLLEMENASSLIGLGVEAFSQGDYPSAQGYFNQSGRSIEKGTAFVQMTIQSMPQ
jgi:hypothetical protein